MKQILLDGKEINAISFDLPLLIHGRDKSGASFFTMNLVLNLLNEKKKILFYSAFKPARIFLIKNTTEETFQMIENVTPTYSEQLIIPISGNIELFKEILRKNYYENYIFVMKNIETFDEELFSLLSSKDNLVFSGNFLNSQGPNKEKMNSIILFSDLEEFGIQKEKIDLYQGFYIDKGTIELW